MEAECIMNSQKYNPYYDDSIKKLRFNRKQRDIHGKLLEIYRYKGIDDMTITDICSSLGIPRTTFYYYYSNVREALDDIENNFLGELIGISGNVVDMYRHDLPGLDDAVERIRDHMQKYRDFLCLTLVTRPDYIFIEKWQKLFMYSYYKYTSDELRLMLIASSCITYYQYCLKNEDTIDIRRGYQLIEYILKNAT